MGDSIRVAAQAQCSPAQLWHTLVDNRAAWWPEMEFTASPGSPLAERAADDGEQRASGTVLAVARDRLLSFRWRMPDWNAHTVVSIQLAASPGPDPETDYTDVVVTESGLGTLAGGADVARTHTEEWADHLANLISLAERGLAG
ncbi:SRPBCC domain-containing protein [Arthrobacter sp. 08Y14]|uniref:SRPBCC family protein n=1 Tax=Arthrobacter sp. 08Y14 TaxID=2058885 RepID=UPI000CE4E419|nr:SRPBCC domain-containing protein [Arthrobacter sp. 08Y14]